MRSLLFYYCLLGPFLALGNPPARTHAKDDASLFPCNEYKTAGSEKIIEGKAFLIQSHLPNLEDQLDLKRFLSHDARGRELLYYLLHTGTNQSVYFALSKKLSVQKGHCEFALKKSLIAQYIQQVQSSDLMTELSNRYRPNIDQDEINVKDLPADEVLIVIVGNGNSPGVASEDSIKKAIILKTDPVSKNLFSIPLDSDFLRGGPRYTHQTL